MHDVRRNGRREGSSRLKWSLLERFREGYVSCHIRPVGGRWRPWPRLRRLGRSTIGSKLAEHLGYEIRVVQTNISVSSRGAVRGIHFADVPPAQAKYVSDLEPVGSAKDAAAPSLDEAAAQGLLPNYDECLAFAENLRRA